MSVQATCGGCRKVYKLPGPFAGKQVRCKQCGTVFTVPRPEPAVPEADPFAGGLDDLLAMERKAQAAPPLAPPHGARPEPLPLRAPRAAATAATAATPLAAPPPLADQSPLASFFKVPDEPYVELPGEEQIDRVVPWIPPAIVVLAAVIFLYQVVSFWLDMAEAFKVSKDQVKLAGPFFRLVGKMAGWGLLLAAIPAPLVALGIFLSSKLLKIRLPEKIYVKSLAVICLPIAFMIVLRFADAPSASAAADPAALASRGSLTEAILPWFWPISIVMMIALLWVLVRQKLVPYAVTVALSAACLAGPALALEYALNPRSRWRGGSTPAWASRGNPHPAPSQPPARTAWRVDPQPAPRERPDPWPERGPTVTQERQPSAPPQTSTQPPPRTPPQTPPRRTTPSDASSSSPPPAVVTQERPTDPQPPPPAPPEPAGPTRADVERAMEKVGRGIQAFVAAKNGQFPRALDEVVAAGHLAEADLTVAPRVRLIYNPHPRFRQGMPGAVIVLYEAGFPDGRRSLLQADGTVRTIPLDEFGKALAESNNLVWKGAP